MKSSETHHLHVGKFKSILLYLLGSEGVHGFGPEMGPLDGNEPLNRIKSNRIKSSRYDNEIEFG